VPCETGAGRLFASADLRAEPFSDPEEFLGYARTHRPEVALVDVCMPQMSGLEVQSRLRKISPSTRVIIFTGKDNPLVRSTALKHECRHSLPNLLTTKHSSAPSGLRSLPRIENLVPKL